MLKKIKRTENYDEFLISICTIVFWGSLWGIVEATLGYLLHKINFTFGWCIWFPLAFYFMNKIYKKTGKAEHMLYGALVTSTIKLTNLFIEIRVDKVINPSVSIVLEAVAVVLIYKMLEKNHKRIGMIEIASVNLLWRGLYAIYLLLLPESLLAISPLRGLEPLLKFMLLESIVNTIIIAAYIKLKDRLPNKLIKESIKDLIINPIPSFLVFIFAIMLQLFI